MSGRSGALILAAMVRVSSLMIIWTRTDKTVVDFNVTIPEGLETACGEAGNCVLQWYWYASGNKQTYESCLDFIIDGTL